MSWITVIGFVAGILTTMSFLPQVIRTWKMKSAREISMGMLILLGAGIFLWLVYGIFIGEKPIIAANGITFALIMIILAMKIRYE